MKTPQFISYKEWHKRVDKWFSKDAFLVSEENKHYCAHCTTQLKGIHAYIIA